MSDPRIGDRWVSTDQAGACDALGIGVVVGPLVFVTVTSVFPDVRKVIVSDEFWLTYEQLERFFRPRHVAASEERPA